MSAPTDTVDANTAEWTHHVSTRTGFRWASHSRSKLAVFLIDIVTGHSRFETESDPLLEVSTGIIQDELNKLLALRGKALTPNVNYPYAAIAQCAQQESLKTGTSSDSATAEPSGLNRKCSRSPLPRRRPGTEEKTPLNDANHTSVARLFEALRKQGIHEDAWIHQLNAGVKHGKLVAGDLEVGKDLLNFAIAALSDQR